MPSRLEASTLTARLHRIHLVDSCGSALVDAKDEVEEFAVIDDAERSLLAGEEF